MAKLIREQHKVFGLAGSSSEFAQFGSEVALAPLKSKDIATIQSLPAWDDGFQDAIFGANKAVLLEDLNAWAYEHSYQVGTIFEEGIAEWEVGTTYYKGSVVKRRTGGGDGTLEFYGSLVDNNTGNAPPTQASNANWLWLNPPVLTPTATIPANAIPKGSGASAVGPAGSAGLQPSLLSDDGVNVIIGGVPGTNGVKFPDGTVQQTAAINNAVTTQNVVTGSRAQGIVYRNMGVKPLYVQISVVLVVGSAPRIVSDSNPSPTTVVAQGGFSDDSTQSVGIQYCAIVLPGNYYKLTGANSVTAWIEYQ